MASPGHSLTSLISTGDERSLCSTSCCVPEGFAGQPSSSSSSSGRAVVPCPRLPPARLPPPCSHSLGFFCPEVTKLPVIPLCQFFPDTGVVLSNIYLPAASSAAVPLRLRCVPMYLSQPRSPQPLRVCAFARLHWYPPKPGFIKRGQPQNSFNSCNRMRGNGLTLTEGTFR